MTASSSSWIGHLANSREISSIFSRGGLKLSGLLLLELKYKPGNKFQIVLLSEEVPEDAPDRWREKGAIAVKLCFDVGVLSLNFHVEKEFDEMPSLTVILEEGRFQLVAEADASSLKISVRALYTRLTVEPVLN